MYKEGQFKNFKAIKIEDRPEINMLKYYIDNECNMIGLFADYSMGKSSTLLGLTGILEKGEEASKQEKSLYKVVSISSVNFLYVPDSEEGRSKENREIEMQKLYKLIIQQLYQQLDSDSYILRNLQLKKKLKLKSPKIFLISICIIFICISSVYFSENIYNFNIQSPKIYIVIYILFILSIICILVEVLIMVYTHLHLDSFSSKNLQLKKNTIQKSEYMNNEIRLIVEMIKEMCRKNNNTTVVVLIEDLDRYKNAGILQSLHEISSILCKSSVKYSFVVALKPETLGIEETKYFDAIVDLVPFYDRFTMGNMISKELGKECEGEIDLAFLNKVAPFFKNNRNIIRLTNSFKQYTNKFSIKNKKSLFSVLSLRVVQPQFFYPIEEVGQNCFIDSILDEYEDNTYQRKEHINKFSEQDLELLEILVNYGDLNTKSLMLISAIIDDFDSEYASLFVMNYYEGNNAVIDDIDIQGKFTEKDLERITKEVFLEKDLLSMVECIHIDILEYLVKRRDYQRLNNLLFFILDFSSTTGMDNKTQIANRFIMDKNFGDIFKERHLIENFHPNVFKILLNKLYGKESDKQYLYENLIVNIKLDYILKYIIDLSNDGSKLELPIEKFNIDSLARLVEKNFEENNMKFKSSTITTILNIYPDIKFNNLNIITLSERGSEDFATYEGNNYVLTKDIVSGVMQNSDLDNNLIFAYLSDSINDNSLDENYIFENEENFILFIDYTEKNNQLKEVSKVDSSESKLGISSEEWVGFIESNIKNYIICEEFIESIYNINEKYLKVDFSECVFKTDYTFVNYLLKNNIIYILPIEEILNFLEYIEEVKDFEILEINKILSKFNYDSKLIKVVMEKSKQFCLKIDLTEELKSIYKFSKLTHDTLLDLVDIIEYNEENTDFYLAQLENNYFKKYYKLNKEDILNEEKEYSSIDEFEKQLNKFDDKEIKKFVIKSNATNFKENNKNMKIRPIEIKNQDNEIIAELIKKKTFQISYDDLINIVLNKKFLNNKTAKLNKIDEIIIDYLLSFVYKNSVKASVKAFRKDIIDNKYILKNDSVVIYLLNEIFNEIDMDNYIDICIYQITENEDLNAYKILGNTEKGKREFNYIFEYISNPTTKSKTIKKEHRNEKYSKIINLIFKEFEKFKFSEKTYIIRNIH